MITTETQHLERAALAAHRAGESWNSFWQRIGDQVRAIEPYNRPRFRRLHNRLAHLVLTGDESGMYPPGDPDSLPWLGDDASPDDVRTVATLQPAVQRQLNFPEAVA